MRLILFVLLALSAFFYSLSSNNTKTTEIIPSQLKKVDSNYPPPIPAEPGPATGETYLEAYMQQFDQSTASAALTTITMELAGGLIMVGFGGWAYFTKIKGSTTKQSKWWLAVVVTLLVGLTLFLAGAFGLIDYLTAPVITRS
jgi:hypothetical protein